MAAYAYAIINDLYFFSWAKTEEEALEAAREEISDDFGLGDGIRAVGLTKRLFDQMNLYGPPENTENDYEPWDLYTEDISCETYVDFFARNQNDIEDWREDYPEGLSVADILNNDTTIPSWDQENEVIEDMLQAYRIEDPENIDTRYKI